MNYIDLLKNINPIKEIEVNIEGVVVSIKERLQELDKYALVRVAVDTGFNDESGMYDVLYSNVLFHLLLLRAYTNIEIEDAKLDGEELFMLYEAFSRLNLFKIIRDINIEEYDSLFEMKDNYLDMKFKQQRSFTNLAELLSFGDLSDLDKLNDPETQQQIQNLVEVTKPLTTK